jgi:hypothetical protein
VAIFFCCLEESELAISDKTVQDFTSGAVFNGWTIIPTPFSPGFRSVEFSINDTVGEAVSPFTQQGQYQVWPGGDFWEATVTLPKMTRAQAVQWIAFLMALKGEANCFLLGDPSMRIPQGSPTGLPVVDGSISTDNQAMSSVLKCQGFAPNSFRNLLPGDYIQVGNRMHALLNTANADGAGKCAMHLWPSLREAAISGSSIITHNAKGLFRLASNKRTWSVDETRLFGLSFRVMEAK